jgi:cobalt-zinc-cadmium efflux system outer membrane protein
MNWVARTAVLLLAPVPLGCVGPPVAIDRLRDPPAPVARRPTADGQGGVVPAGALQPAQLPPPRPVEAAPDAPLSLEDLEELADRVNPTMRRDRAQVEAARGQAVQAGLFPNPQWNTNNPWVINGRQTLLNAGVQQEVPVMGKKNLDRAAATEAVRQAEITYAQNRAALHASIRLQFYLVLADQERVQVFTRLAEIARQSYEAVVGKQKAGDATEIDVRLLLVAAQRADAALRSATAILEGDRKQLEAIVGVPGIIRGPLRGQLSGPYPEFDERELVAYVTRNHTQVEFALSVIRQNRVLLRRAEVEPYPNPTIGPAYQIGVIPGNDQFWLNFTFNVPVWDRNQGNIRAAHANLVSAAESADVSRLNLVNQAENLLSQYRAARAVVERYESGILANANEALRLVQAGYAKGVVDRATLLQAQQNAAQANSDYVDALQNLWTNAAQLSGLLQLERFPVKAPPGSGSLPPR